MRLLRAAPAALLLSIALTGTAAAAPPDGNWSFIRNDGYEHYACKQKASKDGRWRIQAASWFNNDQKAVDIGIGLYAAVARGSNDNVVSSRTVTDWENGWAFATLRGARESDRLWMQAAAYGPPEPWSDGRRIERIKRCAKD